MSSRPPTCRPNPHHPAQSHRQGCRPQSEPPSTGSWSSGNDLYAKWVQSRASLILDPYYFLFACLVGGDEDAELHVVDDGKTRFLTGTPVSSLYHLKDLDNSDAAFFVFPDLGVRKEGRYRLKLTLFEIIE